MSATPTLPRVIKLTNGLYAIKFDDGSRGPSYPSRQAAAQALATYLEGAR